MYHLSVDRGCSRNLGYADQTLHTHSSAINLTARFTMKKQCSVCKKFKKFRKFRTHPRYKYGVYSTCKKCEQIGRRSLSGKIGRMHQNQVRSSKIRKHPMPNYAKQELIDWCLAQPLYHELHKTWKRSGYETNLAPSCDRIDDYKPYTLDNIKLVTWGDNNRKSHADRKQGINNKASKEVVQYSIRRKTKVAAYFSAREAERTTGINNANIIQCCRGKAQTAGGYKWRYSK